MTEYRIVEAYRKIWIEKQTSGGNWLPYDNKHVPRFFDSLADARSWVATIKRGVVYHDAEEPITESYDELVDRLIKPDAPNLPVDELEEQESIWWSVTPCTADIDHVKGGAVAIFENEEQAMKWGRAMHGIFYWVLPHPDPR